MAQSVRPPSCVSAVLCLQDESTGEITFYMKGADVVMAGIVQYNDWLEEEVREGCFSALLLGFRPLQQGSNS